jgi:adenine deaminase
MICEEQSNPHAVIREGGIDSAIHSAFYPGLPPFQHGGIAKLAGALCYYLTKAHAFMDGNKRTAALVAVSFSSSYG